MCITLYQLENELLKKEKSRLLYKEKVQSSENQLLMILLVCSVLIIGAAIIIFMYRHRSANLKQRLNANALEMRNKEVTNLSIYIKQKGMFINLIRDDLKEIRRTNNPEKKNNLITSLFAKVGTYAKIDNESLAVKEQIEGSTQEFMDRLSMKFPDLTTKEKRLAQLLYMDLSSKEIALLLNIASQSVDTARYRLRKKLNLSRDEELNAIFKDV